MNSEDGTIIRYLSEAHPPMNKINTPQQLKWDKIYRNQPDRQPTANEVLADYQHLLPQQGRALDLACGLGGDALLLAARGLDVTAWDCSNVALERLQQAAERQQSAITVEPRDIDHCDFPTECFDVITVGHFLSRPLSGKIVTALKPGGLLFIQTWCREKAAGIGPANPDFLLAPNELLTLFSALKVVLYREEAKIGDLSQGWRNQAMLIGQRGY